MLAAITSEIMRLKAHHFGKGPSEGKAYLNGSWVVCFLKGGFTKVEETLIGAGDEALVRQVRLRFQEQMSVAFRDSVEKITGRSVVGYASQIVVNPDFAVELFLLEDGEDLDDVAPPM
ncbi:MAG: DUF2294 domain-containing protein, partial [Actinobacteria bacterium]|nr:DUF2294 domain-containing protein [Actinomycetota bacterium]